MTFVQLARVDRGLFIQGAIGLRIRIVDREHGALIGALLRGAVMRHLMLEAKRGELCRVVRDAGRIDMGGSSASPRRPGCGWSTAQPAA